MNEFYNGENRPVRFENEETGTVVECGYDFRGRRFSKKVSVSGTVSLNQRCVCREFLQIACEDLLRDAQPALWFVLWDPTETVATRPLAIQKDGTWFTFGWDITKNVWELFGSAGYIRTTYSYEPFGNVSMNASGVVQPFRFSSEFYDSELDLIYYNYRHYSPALGRFLSRDPIEELGGLNLYAFAGNDSIKHSEKNGLVKCQITIAIGHGVWETDEEGNMQKDKKGRTVWSYSMARRYFSERFRRAGGNLSDTEKIVIVSCGANYKDPNFYATSGLVACCAQKVVESWKIDDIDYTDKILISTLQKKKKALVNAAKKDARNICCRSDCAFVSIVFEYIQDELKKALDAYSEGEMIVINCDKKSKN